jgi:hypothetical protein
MPIKGVSEIRRLPRLGKIRLGEKALAQSGKGYPKSVDYFVCPPEVRAVYGEKPRVLDVAFPVEDKDVFFPQWYKRYGQSTGLICKGDGEMAVQANSETGEMQEIECCPDECEWYTKKHCRRLASLQFMLPKVPGIGVYQIDTTSFYSIININSGVEMIRSVAGRIKMIPLQLVLQPQEVQPEGMKKKTVYIMNLIAPFTLQKLIAAGQSQSPVFLLPGVSENERPEDLYPDAVLEKQDKKPLDLDEKAVAVLVNPPDPPEQEESLIPDWVSPSTPVTQPEEEDPVDRELQAAWDALGTPPAKQQAILKKPGLDKHGLLVQLQDEISTRGVRTEKTKIAPPKEQPAPARQQQSFF